MKIKKFFLLAALGLMASATFTSCDDILGEWSRPAPVTPTTVSVTSIMLSETTLKKNVGDAAVTLTATVAPDNADDKSLTWSSDKPAVATVADGVVTIVGKGIAIITATANDGSGIKATCYVGVAPVGAVAGLFSVSNTKQVQFSQGNLQYQASTSTWRFAENQHDYIGDAAGNNTSTGRSTQAGWIDLFGWGTAGHFFSTGYGALYQPWDRDDSNDGTKFGPSGTSNGLYGAYAQGDWGTNAISNGGNTADYGWRTLTGNTNGEWKYLFKTRSASTIGGTDDARYAKAYLFGTTHGVILFPDSYTHPDGVALPTGINNEGATSWNANTYTAADWAKMEAAGCVFLPTAGIYSTSVNRVGSEGYYWTSSPDALGNYTAYFAGFSSSSLYYDNTTQRCIGFSVRLVLPVE